MQSAAHPSSRWRGWGCSLRIEPLEKICDEVIGCCRSLLVPGYKALFLLLYCKLIFSPNLKPMED
ncbi:MAG: hypothetical protein J6C11_11405 [Spirochaetaceae bacterium]|nr:hypothetical protein [Spirochaetaceae bacterium]